MPGSLPLQGIFEIPLDEGIVAVSDMFRPGHPFPGRGPVDSVLHHPCPTFRDEFPRTVRHPHLYSLTNPPSVHGQCAPLMALAATWRSAAATSTFSISADWTS